MRKLLNTRVKISYFYQDLWRRRQKKKKEEVESLSKGSKGLVCNKSLIIGNGFVKFKSVLEIDFWPNLSKSIKRYRSKMVDDNSGIVMTRTLRQVFQLGKNDATRFVKIGVLWRVIWGSAPNKLYG